MVWELDVEPHEVSVWPEHLVEDGAMGNIRHAMEGWLEGQGIPHRKAVTGKRVLAVQLGQQRQLVDERGARAEDEDALPRVQVVHGEDFGVMPWHRRPPRRAGNRESR